jgi:PAS domain S-box-containing protein
MPDTNVGEGKALSGVMNTGSDTGAHARTYSEPRANILLVDDRPSNLVALEATLAPLNQRIVKASSGEEALKHLLLDEFALILLDVQMPGMDGFETAALIKEHPRTRHVPIIFITAISREATHLFRGYQHGAVDYLLKPVDTGILRSKAAVFIDLWRKEKQIAEQSARLHERERADDQLRSQHRFRERVDALPLCVWALRADGKIEYASSSWRRYAGIADSAPPDAGMHLHHVHADDRDRVVLAWQKTMETGERLDLEFRLRRASDETFRWHIGSLVPQRDEVGNLVGWIATATDIEKQKRAEEAYVQLVDKEREAREAAEAANRAKDEFLATVSHELRTPLNAMVGWTRMLRTHDLPPEKQIRALETIERNAQAQAELIEDILDVSRIITGKLRLEVKPVDLPAVLEAAIDSVRPAAESKGIVLERAVGELPQKMMGDPARLQQIAWNLLSNAIKFTPPGGRVELGLRQEATMVHISVADNGRGIEPAFLPFVFDRFRQYDSSSKRAHGGLGLGLAIVRHLIELHGGTVEVDSPGPGQGSTFTVRLPARPADAVAAAEPAEVAAPARESGPVAVAVAGLLDVTGDGGGAQKNEGDEDGAGGDSDSGGTAPSLQGLRVLLVDDEPDARELLTEVLAQYGADSQAAGSVDEALTLLADYHPDVLVSDIGLPVQDGYALISQVRALPPDRGGAIPAAALTAYARPEDRRRALAAGFHRYAVKPIHPTALAQLVADLARSAKTGLPG